MLPSERRLRTRADFTQVVRRGRRASRPLLTVHLDRAGATAPAAAGLVVSKAVGGSVVRHAVSRRLRHLLAGRLRALPPGSRVVVRATPAAAAASSQDLARDLDRVLDRLLPGPGAAPAPGVRR